MTFALCNGSGWIVLNQQLYIGACRGVMCIPIQHTLAWLSLMLSVQQPLGVSSCPRVAACVSLWSPLQCVRSLLVKRSPHHQGTVEHGGSVNSPKDRVQRTTVCGRPRLVSAAHGRPPRTAHAQWNTSSKNKRRDTES